MKLKELALAIRRLFRVGRDPLLPGRVTRAEMMARPVPPPSPRPPTTYSGRIPTLYRPEGPGFHRVTRHPAQIAIDDVDTILARSILNSAPGPVVLVPSEPVNFQVFTSAGGGDYAGSGASGGWDSCGSSDSGASDSGSSSSDSSCSSD